MTPQAHRTALGILLLAFLLPAAASGQGAGGLGQDLAELEQGQQEILRQIGEIRRLLQGRNAAKPPVPAGPDVKNRVFDLGANPVKGERTAPLTLVEFTDYQ